MAKKKIKTVPKRQIAGSRGMHPGDLGDLKTLERLAGRVQRSLEPVERREAKLQEDPLVEENRKLKEKLEERAKVEEPTEPELLAVYQLGTLSGALYKVNGDPTKTTLLRLNLPIEGKPMGFLFPPEDALLVRELLDRILKDAVIGQVVPPRKDKL